MYTDPSGEFIHWIVGGLSGAFSGWQIGKMKGATGWDMAGYILGGAAIGAASAGVGSIVSTAMGATTTLYGSQLAVAVGGMSASAISSAGFTALAGGNGSQIFNAAWKGAVSGIAGSLAAGLGTYYLDKPLMYGTGAAIGGAVSSGVNAGLNGGNASDVLKAGLFGGVSAMASYQASTFAANKIFAPELSFHQFKAMNWAAQCSFWDKHEYAGWLMKGGRVEFWPVTSTGEANSPYPTGGFDNIIGDFHTHGYDMSGVIGESIKPTEEDFYKNSGLDNRYYLISRFNASTYRYPETINRLFSYYNYSPYFYNTSLHFLNLRSR